MAKRYDNLYHQVTDSETLEAAYLNTLRGKLKYQKSCLLFSHNVTANLMELRSRLLDGSFEFHGYYNFRVFEPVERNIWAPKYVDKIVQHALNLVLRDIYEPMFISTSYACIRKRGTHRAVHQITHDLQVAKRNWSDPYIVKMDIRHFFASIDRDVMKTIIRKRIKCRPTLELINQLIDTAPDSNGLPLGNLTSQLFANVYMNQLDQYAKRDLHIKHWVRYSDDIVAVVENRDQARQLLSDVERFLDDNLKLKLHPKKSKIFPLSQGVNALGFKIYPTHRLLRDDSKKRIKRKLKKFPRLIREGNLTITKARQILNSWQGHADNGCSANFKKSLAAAQPDFLVYREQPNWLYIKDITIKKNVS